MDTVIYFKNVSKQYRIGQARYNSLREDISNSFRKIFNFNKGSEDKNFIWALKDVSFEVKKGESLGIIGPNGAGKTTILKLISRITLPTEGSVSAQGKLSALIELGAGLHPELSGRENIYLYGSIMGMKRRVIEKRFDEIVDFSGLKQFIDTPVKKYSSGMYVRLGFAVAIFSDPEILLVDEVLAVGDIGFQKKCLESIRAFIRNGKTMIFVSHNLVAVQGICERVILLNKGKILKDSRPEESIRAYYELSTLEQGRESGSVQDKSRWGERSMEIIKVAISNSASEETDTFRSSERAAIHIVAKCNNDIDRPIFGIKLYNNEGVYIYGTNTSWLGFEFPRSFKKGEITKVSFTQDLSLTAGIYYISPAVTDSTGKIIFDWCENAAKFKIISDKNTGGIVNLNSKVSFE